MEQKALKKNVLFIISVLLNIMFLILLGFYLFTPFLDYGVLNRSMPRLCNYIENSQPELQPTFCDVQE